ncbi:MAG: hypothetical protein H0X25_09105 [Acidobacteriales bacterium]|nr:hypothetical protein [Terriglobales bacterium]
MACTIACSLPGVAQNIITNGSFEMPIVPPGSFTQFVAPDTASIPGWNVIGPPGKNVFIGSTTLCDPGPPKVCYPAQEGIQFLDLTGAGSNGAEGVEVRTGSVVGVPTTIGEYYQLSYWIGNVSVGGGFGVKSTVQLSVNNSIPTPDINSLTTPVVNGTANIVWQQVIHVFQATLATTRIKFLNGDPSSDGINGLDNVVLLHICQCQ